MFEYFFSKPCTAFVGENGRALSADALEAAKAAMYAAESANFKVWSDRNGFVFKRERKLFAPAIQLTDAAGNPVRVCGRRVSNKAKFCSKCGAPAPGGEWRCGGCGKLIPKDAQTCPHCGKQQNINLRVDLSNGMWKKPEDVFAERFEFPDVTPLLGKGLNVQENQCAILLQGGAVTEILSPGFHELFQQDAADAGNKSLVMVDNSEFTLSVGVENVLTSDDLAADLHLVLALRFSPENAKEFMCNLMGNSLLLHDDNVSASVGYDEVSRTITQTVDAAARNFCNTYKVEDLFRDADIRLNLEKQIEQALIRNIGAMGLKFLRLKEADFDSEVFTQLREKSGKIEVQRREIEFMMRVNELANEAAKNEALGEHDLEEYISKLAQDKKINEELRNQELEHLRIEWQRKKETEAAEAGMAMEMRREEHKEDLEDLHHNRELDRRIRDQKSSVEYMQLEVQIQDIKLGIEKKKAENEAQIQDIKLESEKKKVAAEQESAAAWLKIKQQKEEFNQKQKIDMINAAKGADISALLMAEDDPEKRAQLLQLYEQQMQTKMTPELLLAAAAARGNPAAAEALSKMNGAQLEAIERSKQENKEVFQQMLQMNERMFTSSLDSLSKANVPPSSTTQIIK